MSVTLTTEAHSFMCNEHNSMCANYRAEKLKNEKLKKEIKDKDDEIQKLKKENKKHISTIEKHWGMDLVIQNEKLNNDLDVYIEADVQMTSELEDKDEEIAELKEKIGSYENAEIIKKLYDIYKTDTPINKEVDMMLINESDLDNKLIFELVIDDYANAHDAWNELEDKYEEIAELKKKVQEGVKVCEGAKESMEEMFEKIAELKKENEKFKKKMKEFSVYRKADIWKLEQLSLLEN